MFKKLILTAVAALSVLTASSQAQTFSGSRESSFELGIKRSQKQSWTGGTGFAGGSHAYDAGSGYSSTPYGSKCSTPKPTHGYSGSYESEQEMNPQRRQRQTWDSGMGSHGGSRESSFELNVKRDQRQTWSGGTGLGGSTFGGSRESSMELGIKRSSRTTFGSRP